MWAAFLFGALPTFAQVLQPVIPITPPQRPMPEGVGFNTAAIPLRWGLAFISGATQGLNQVVAFHPDKFFSRYPDANRRYWDNDISWRNKWKGGDREQGEAFFGSSTFLAWTTDAYHLSGTLSRVNGVASLSIPLYSGSGKKLKHYAAEVGFSAVGYWMGFHGVYSLWFR